MKTSIRTLIMAALMGAVSLQASAQQVTTLYFLENAPMRHTINPAFQPVSKGFINFSPLGWMSMSIGNNSLTMSDVIYTYKDPNTNQITTITALHPNANKQALMNVLRSVTFANGEMNVGILNMGFRIKDNGYLTIGLNERIELGGTIPKSGFDFFLGGGLKNLGTPGATSIGLNGLGMTGHAYTELGVGYSHRINDKWTVGGKAKFLLGEANAAMNAKQLSMLNNDAATLTRIQGNFDMALSGPFDPTIMDGFDGKSLQQVINEISSGQTTTGNQIIDFSNIGRLLTPSGYGAAFDLGFTYKPIEQLQISAAVNDLGFLYWTNAQRYTATIDTTYSGLNVNYDDPAFRDANGNFNTQKLVDSTLTNIQNITNSIILRKSGAGYAKMLSARLNIGVDANFWDNRVGVGIVSATRLYNARLYEEVTIGAAFRPVNWFNIAVSYSLLNNGKYSNIGAGLSFMPYDGVNMTLAMDYIPTSYAGLPNPNGAPGPYVIPYKAKQVNLALGFSICWGSNRKDKDRDGVWDKLDMCPNTPRGVAVDEHGCPLDGDGDGVPDYLDVCPNTPEAAIGHVDQSGCAKDSDGDGVEDYRDRCPDTPKEAWGKVDTLGCPLDSDGDHVPDYIDECPDTPKEAWGSVDNVGCPIDSDKDGVPDYLDQEPNTPAGIAVDSLGRAVDSDGDGVPDYKDECPNTPEKAIGFVNDKGCELDSDGDGVPDYLDQCPTVAGPETNKGCPEIKREVRQLLQKAMQGIEFESGKATIKSKSYPLLDLIASIFISNKDYIIEVQGHTDNTGKAEVNKKISQQRADAVMKYLVKAGVPAERMSAHGYGSDKPIADNKTAKGRQKNRRVEFNITFEQITVESVMDHATPATPSSEAPATEAPATENSDTKAAE